jgi:hypothetical protein
MLLKIMLAGIVLLCGFNGYEVTNFAINHSHVTHVTPVVRHSPEMM